MISQVDIDDWTDDDFIDVVEDIPEQDRKVEIKADGDESVIDLKRLIVAYGRALHTRFKMTLKA